MSLSRFTCRYEKTVSDQIEVSRKQSLVRLIADSLESKVESLYKQFVDLSARASCGIVDYRRLRRSDFETLLPSILEEINKGAKSKSRRKATRFDFTDAFVAFDQNRDNYVDAKEFVIGISLVFPNASFEEKVAACFRAFDVRRLNRLHIDEVSICLKWCVFCCWTCAPLIPCVPTLLIAFVLWECRMRNFLMALDPDQDSPNALKCENIDDYLETYEVQVGGNYVWFASQFWRGFSVTVMGFYRPRKRQKWHRKPRQQHLGAPVASPASTSK